jgi:hypothetical protein
MAKTKIEVDLVVKGGDSVGQVENKVVSLKQQLKNLKAELASGNLTGKAFDDAAKKAGELQDRIGDVSTRVKNLASDSKRLDGFVSLAQGIVGGFAAVQGITALVGDENKELEKTMLKLQGTMTALAGIQAVVNTLNKESALSTNLFSSAWSKLNNVMKASIIGAIVAATLLLISYWDDIKELITGVDTETKKLAETTKNDFEASKKKTDELDKQDNILKLQGVSEKEILRSKIKQTDETIKAGEIALQNQKNVLTAQLASEKKSKEILTSIMAFIEVPLKSLLRGIDSIGKNFGMNWDLENKYKSVAEIFFNPEETQAEGQKVIDEIDSNLLDLKNKRAGFELQIKAIDKQAKADATKTKQDQDAENEKYDKQSRERQKRKSEEDQKAKDEELQRDKETVEAKQKLAEEQIAAEKAADEKAKADKKLADEKATQAYIDNIMARQSIAQSSFDIISNLGELAIGQQFKQTALGKTLALAQIATDTAVAISSAGVAAAKATAATGNPLSGVAVYVTTVAGILANVLRAKSILSGGGASGGSSGSGNGGGAGQQQNSNPPSITGFTRGTDAQGNPITKVVVLEKDITNSQARVARIRTNAELI